MASKGSKKELSIRQEDRIASLYRGTRSPSSGGAVTDNGDVRARHWLFECKYKGSPAEPLKSMPGIVKQFEKIADEAWSESRFPALALRFYLPDSVLADDDGWVDLTVKLSQDDAHAAH